MGSRFKQNFGNKELPGPGQYTNSFLSESGTKYKFGSESRMKLNLSMNQMLPGPGNYNSDYEKVAKKDGATVFGKSKQRDDSLEKRYSSLPGPGAYN